MSDLRQMLLNGGELDGVRILGPKTVAYMTQNHIDGVHQPGYGFGLGFSVRIDDKAAGVIGTEGTYGWNGAANTHYFADPEEEVIGLFSYTAHAVWPLSPVAVFQSSAVPGAGEIVPNVECRVIFHLTTRHSKLGTRNS